MVPSQRAEIDSCWRRNLDPVEFEPTKLLARLEKVQDHPFIASLEGDRKPAQTPSFLSSANDFSQRALFA
jgi:hypothetical protein